MAEKLVMLALSPTMEKGIIVKWHKQEGDKISAGDVVCEVETDKAVMEYPASTEGVLRKIIVKEGESAAVEEPIGIVGDPDEDITSLLDTLAKKTEKPEPPQKEEPGEKKEEKPEKKEKPPVPPSAGKGACPLEKAKKEAEEKPAEAPTEEKIRSSPLARKMAQEAGLDLSNIRGTGPDGRITRQDIEKTIEEQKAAKAPRAEMAEETIEITSKRRIIAERLSESMFSAPHYYLRVSVLMDRLIEERTRHNAEAENKISLNAYLIKLAAETIKHHPMVNATWQNDKIVKHGSIDVGLAVAIPDGLVAPVVRDCANKGIVQIDSELRELVDRAKNNRLRPEDYENATFTITNLGSFGIEQFTAIINPPGSAILAVGSIQRKPVVDAHDDLVIRSVMEITLSCDHRIVDGAIGAAFLTDLKAMFESPIRALYG